MDDQRGPYLKQLTASPAPRHHWGGHAPDKPAEEWYFETVIDDGDHIAIRQLTITPDGQRHAYSADHLEDEWGFLTDLPIDPDVFEGIHAVALPEFEAEWAT